MKSHFPIINYFEKKHIIYADSAATTLKLKTVIDSVSNFYSFETSNVFRGLHLLAETATEKVEMSRDIVAAFIGANSSEIVFTSGATESINIVANGIEYEDDSEIIVSILEHHSNYLPWIEKAKVISLEIDEYGYIDIEQLRDNITCKTKLIAVTYISNVTGNIQPIKNIIDIAHQNGINVLVDATQAISHIPIDVKEIDCDYLVFSSHKIFGPSGVGVLYCKDSLLDKLNILKFGGGMVNRIYSNRNIIYKDPPYSFEAGTPNIEGIIGLGASLDFFKNNRLAIYNHLRALNAYIVDKFRQFDFVKFPFVLSKEHIPIFSILPHNTILNSLEVAKILATNYDIVINHGYQCSQPLYRKFHIDGGAIRFSFHVYNTKEDVDYIFESLSNILISTKM